MPAKNGSSRFVLKLLIALVVLAAIGVGVAAALRPVATVAEVRRDKAVDLVTGSVQVHPDGGVREIKAEVGGWVVWCDAIDRDRKFKAEDILVKLDTSEIERQIAEKQRQFDVLQERRELLLKSSRERVLAEERLNELLRRQQFGTVTEEEIKVARRELEDVKAKQNLNDFDNQRLIADHKAQMEELNRQLEKMTIKAPWDGVINEPRVTPGALVLPTQTIATAYSNARIVVAKISEEDFRRVRLDQPAKVRLLIYGDEEFDAKVTKIINMADPDTQRYTVYLDVALEPEKLAPFSTGEVSIIIGESENSLLIPRRAVFNNNQVFVVKNGRVEQRKVTVGFVSLIDIEIREGLAAGEQVIVEGLEQFRDGQRVRVRAYEDRSAD